MQQRYSTNTIILCLTLYFKIRYIFLPIYFCFARINILSERENLNAGTGNFVYVFSECYVISVYALKFSKKMGKASKNFEKTFKILEQKQ